MTRKIGTVVLAITVSLSLFLASGFVAGPGAHAATHGTAGSNHSHAAGARAATARAASRACMTSGNSVFQYAGTSITTTHGACVTTITSGGHSSAAAASLCSYLVKNSGSFSNVKLVTAFPQGAAATTLTSILGKLSSAGRPTTVGQCVRMYNQAKQAVLRAQSGSKG